MSETKRVEFTIHGAPQGKGRARTVRNRATGRSMSYTPEKTVEYENLVRMEYQAQCGGAWLGEQTPIAAVICVSYPIPASVSKKKREEMLDGQIFPTKKPDCDNIAKVILDALNGIAYRDDAQVIFLLMQKRYSETPRVDVHMWQTVGDYAPVFIQSKQEGQRA